MATTEIAAKTQHVRNLKAQIDKLESERGRIEDWVKSKEKEVDELNNKKNVIHKKIKADIIELEEKKKQIDGLLEDLTKKNFQNNKSANKARMEREALEVKKLELHNFKNELNSRKESLDEREGSVKVREKYIKGIFDGIDRLRG